MIYTAAYFLLDPPTNDAYEMLSALLDYYNFEGITQSDNETIGYIPAESFDESCLDDIRSTLLKIECKLDWRLEEIRERNWNAVWESNFEPVVINELCAIRAPFHTEITNVKYEIVIEPKMSFGTGHHQTTSLMIGQLLKLSVEGKSVLDMGCGTGVLAILAGLSGGKRIVGIDIDEWAYKNSIENASRNNISHIQFLIGGKDIIPDEKFDIILANINRNILLDQMSEYAKHCKKNGSLLISGILEDDKQIIEECACKVGFSKVGYNKLNKWVMMMFERK